MSTPVSLVGRQAWYDTTFSEYHALLRNNTGFGIYVKVVWTPLAAFPPITTPANIIAPGETIEFVTVPIGYGDTTFEATAEALYSSDGVNFVLNGEKTFKVNSEGYR